MAIASPRLIYPNSREMTFTQSWLMPVLSRSLPGAALLCAMAVVPLTDVTFVSLMYLDYLNFIVHREIITDVCHHILSPIITVLLFAALDNFGAIPYMTGPLANPATLVLTGFLIWFSFWGIFEKGVDNLPFLAGFMAFVNISFYFLGLGFNIFVAPQLPASSFYHPAVLCIFASWLQAMSHGFEEWLPVQACGVARWVKLRQWARSNFLVHGPLLLLQSIPGTISEFLVTPKLNGLHTLFYMWKLTGYGAKHYEVLSALVKEAVGGDRNPAVNFIGTGGAALASEAKVDLVANEYGLLPRAEAAEEKPYIPDVASSGHTQVA